MKTLHDIPVITDATEIDTQQIFDPIIRNDNNRLEVILRPVTPEEAIAFWSAEHESTTRLSAYYEVRIVMLGEWAPNSVEDTPMLTEIGMLVKPGAAIDSRIRSATVTATSARTPTRATQNSSPP